MPKLNLSESQPMTKPARIDRDAGVIYDVKVGGLTSANGNDYSAEVYRKSLHLYEGRKVNLNHRKRSEKSEDRSIVDRFGRLREARVGEDGVYANLHYNPRHPMAESILWFAEHDPEAIGFSQYATGTGRKKRDGRWQIESIDSVLSVDLVADQASTKSLFESQEPEMADAADTPPPVPDAQDHEAAMADAFAQGVMACVKDKSLDLAAKLKKIKDILTAQDKLSGKSDDDDDADAETADASESLDPARARPASSPELATLRREKQVRQLCESLNYQPSAVLVDVLASVPHGEAGDKKVRALVEAEAARAKIAGKAKAPRSASPAGMRESQGILAGSTDNKGLATTLRRI